LVRFKVVFILLVLFASINTLIAFSAILAGAGPLPINRETLATSSNNSTNFGPSAVSSLSDSRSSPLLRSTSVAARQGSFALAPLGWVVVVGAWFWRGRVRSRWMALGFDSDVFQLFMKMRGGATRLKLLENLNAPKDRMQLAQELGLDWKAVDRHVQLLNKYGFIGEQAAYGNVKVYQVTPLGRMLLQLLDELTASEQGREVLPTIPQ